MQNPRFDIEEKVIGQIIELLTENGFNNHVSFPEIKEKQTKGCCQYIRDLCKISTYRFTKKRELTRVSSAN